MLECSSSIIKYQYLFELIKTLIMVQNYGSKKVLTSKITKWFVFSCISESVETLTAWRLMQYVNSAYSFHLRMWSCTYFNLSFSPAKNSKLENFESRYYKHLIKESIGLFWPKMSTHAYIYKSLDIPFSWWH